MKNTKNTEYRTQNAEDGSQKTGVRRQKIPSSPCCNLLHSDCSPKSSSVSSVFSVTSVAIPVVSPPSFVSSCLRGKNSSSSSSPLLMTQDSLFIDRSARQRASGMILLLVIAILVLLAVMGSVYVLMAGADRQSTNASTGNASLALAQTSVLNIVRGQIGTQLTDGSGAYLNAATPVKPYTRTWDMPELGTTTGIAPGTPSSFYTDSQDLYRSEPWLVSLPVWLSESYLPPNTNMLWTGVDPTKIQTAPAAIEIGAYTGGQSTPTPPITGNYSPPSGFTPTVSPGVNYPLFSILSPFLYDPGTGLNDIGMSYQLSGGTAVTTPGTQGTVYVPNASVVFPAWSNSVWPTFNRYGIDDSCWNLLPYSSPNGTRYRFAVRIMDTNSMLNLNVGQASGAAYNPGGQYFNGYGLGYAYDTSTNPPYCTVNNNTGGTSDMLSLLKVAIARSNNGSLANYNVDSVWQQALWTRDAGGTDSAAIALFGTSSELALRAFQGSIPATGIASGVTQPFYDCRVGSVLPYTLGFNPPNGGGFANLGQPWKMFFTTYSKDRPLRPEPDVANPPFGLTSSAAYSVNGVSWKEWPQSPGKIFVNAPADSPALVAGSATNTNAVGADVAGGVALTAAQIAQAMAESGFGTSQGQAFAANYMTYRMGVANGGTNGPSFIDSSGPCIRGYNGTNGNFSGIGTFAAPANELIAGVAAQPFIVQAAVYANVTKTAVNYQNYAVVLYNPFGQAISLQNWILELYNGTAYSSPGLINATIPANGFLVVEQQNGYFTISSSPTATVRMGAMIFAQSSSPQEVVLLRPIVSRTGVSGKFPVDSFNIQPLMTGIVGNFTGGTGTYTLQRNCVPGATTTAGDWYCDNANQTVAPGLWATQLGTATGTPIPPAFGIPLYDRFADPGDCPGYYNSVSDPSGVSAATGSPLLNIADFETSPFVANFASVSGASYLPLSPLAVQVAALPKNTNEPNTNLQYEANARFDFYDDVAAAVPQPAAIKLLDYITFDSAFSDGSVNDGSNIYNKLAVPGRININTASLPVLEAMIGSFDGSTSGTNSPQALATDINQYSLRLGTFSAIRGLGFHSKAELTWALANVLNGVSPTSIAARDNATGFAELYNMATVRSDTFICYTYIQALRLNEAYIQNGGAYNVTDWYNATQGIAIGTEGSIANSSTVNISGTNYYPEFILEGQKRFVALIDRTNATSNGAGATSANPPDPQVVALQGLPQ